MAALVAITAGILSKKWSVGFLIGYVLIILGETVIFRMPVDYVRYKLQLFWSYKNWAGAKAEILANIFVYTPVGVIASYLWKWKGLLFGIGLSLSIEILQLLTCRGWFEFDDLFHNSLGALLGVIIYMIGIKLIKKEISDTRR